MNSNNNTKETKEHIDGIRDQRKIHFQIIEGILFHDPFIVKKETRDKYFILKNPYDHGEENIITSKLNETILNQLISETRKRSDYFIIRHRLIRYIFIYPSILIIFSYILVRLFSEKIE